MCVPYIDADGNPVTPESPNAVKLETFIFDALQLASKTMVLEGDRKEVFGPTKNATGVDSAESCRVKPSFILTLTRALSCEWTRMSASLNV